MLQLENKNKQIDEFILFFEKNQFDSSNVEQFIRRFRIRKILKKIFGFVLIIFALAVIIIPLPRYLEIATLFYFNPDDGITVSDVIALILLLVGIILLIKDNIYYNSITD